MTLQKVILTPGDLKSFQASETHQQILGFVQDLNNSIIGVKLPHDDEASSEVREGTRNLNSPDKKKQGVRAVLNVLNRVRQLAEETPPVDNKVSRFGNPAFKTFYDKVLKVSCDVGDILHVLKPRRSPDLCTWRASLA
jgi:serine/threonine-protein phosphatase 2A activator